MSIQSFDEDYKLLCDFIFAAHPAHLVVFRWENLLVPSGSFSFTTGQGLVSGLLLSYFCNRFSYHASVRSDSISCLTHMTH